MLISAVLAFGGMALAWYYYVAHPDRRPALDQRFSFAVNLLRNRWYIDALYEEKLVEGVILRSADGQHSHRRTHHRRGCERSRLGFSSILKRYALD